MYSDSYYKNIRKEILPFLTKGNHHILELGCGFGETIIYLKRNGYAKKIYGIELNPEAKINRSEEIDDLQIGNLEIMHLDYPPHFFDYIILNDVIEHIINPEVLLRKLIPLLKHSGFIIISIPTIRNWNVLYRVIFKGLFRYEQNGGILDQSHLRFFTFKTMKELFSQLNLTIVDHSYNADCHWLAKFFIKIPILLEFGVVQYLFRLKPNKNIK